MLNHNNNNNEILLDYKYAFFITLISIKLFNLYVHIIIID